MDGERGSVTLWTVGMCMVLLVLGGLSLDLWRAFSERRALAGVADAAAIAGAGAIDVGALRTGGPVALDPVAAEQAALASAAAQADVRSLTAVRAVAAPEGVTVTVEGRVALTLLGLLGDLGDLPVQVSATSGPRAAP